MQGIFLFHLIDCLKKDLPNAILLCTLFKIILHNFDKQVNFQCKENHHKFFQLKAITSANLNLLHDR